MSRAVCIQSEIVLATATVQHGPQGRGYTDGAGSKLTCDRSARFHPGKASLRLAQPNRRAPHSRECNSIFDPCFHRCATYDRRIPPARFGPMTSIDDRLLPVFV